MNFVNEFESYEVFLDNCRLNSRVWWYETSIYSRSSAHFEKKVYNLDSVPCSRN